jgi:predicted Zn-dependent protease
LETRPYQFALSRRLADTAAVQEVKVDVLPDTVCAYDPAVVKDQILNAWADGRNVVVTTAMLRFASTDDELAAIVGHEIAHHAMRHIDAKKKNAGFGAILGAMLDIAAATQGVNTGGDFTRSGAAIGAMTYSQDFEREADYVGMYVIARAGRPFATAPNLWRRMAQESPGSIKYASTHPTSAERFVRLEQIVAEIQRKVAAGEPLVPELKAEAKPD